MRKNLFRPLFWATTALTLVAACSENDTVSDKSLLHVGENQITVPAGGGQAQIRYTLQGSAGSESVQAQCPESWVHSFDTRTAGVVEFTADANGTDQARQAVVTLSCPGADPAQVTLTQPASEPDPVLFAISIEHTTQSGARFKVTPSDPAVNYIALAAKKEVMDSFEDDQARFQADLEHFEQAARKQNITLEELLTSVTCSAEMVFPLSNLTPGETYCVYAYGLTTEGVRTSAISRQEFETLPKTECTFGIEVQLDVYTADVEVTPSGADVLYYIGHLNDTRYQEFGGSMPEAAKKDVATFIALCEALGMSREECVSQMCKSGVRTTKYSGLTPGMKHYFYACALDQTGAVVSDVGVAEVTTVPAGNASMMTFEFAATNLQAIEGTLSVTPSDKTCLYDWGVAKLPQTAESIKQGILDRAEHSINLGIYKDLAAYMQRNCVRGDTSRTVSLEAGTEYRSYAIAVNEDGTFATDVFFSEPFTTPSIVGGSDITIDITCELYFNGDELAKLNKYVYGKFEKAAVGFTTVTTTGDVDTYYYSGFYGTEWLDTELHPDTEFIESIIMWGRPEGKSRLHSWRWDADLVYVAVAVDKNGKYSAVSRKHIICTRDGAAPISEFDPQTMK